MSTPPSAPHSSETPARAATSDVAFGAGTKTLHGQARRHARCKVRPHVRRNACGRAMGGGGDECTGTRTCDSHLRVVCQGLWRARGLDGDALRGAAAPVEAADVRREAAQHEWPARPNDEARAEAEGSGGHVHDASCTAGSRLCLHSTQVCSAVRSSAAPAAVLQNFCACSSFGLAELRRNRQSGVHVLVQHIGAACFKEVHAWWQNTSRIRTGRTTCACSDGVDRSLYGSRVISNAIAYSTPLFDVGDALHEQPLLSARGVGRLSRSGHGPAVLQSDASAAVRAAA